VRRMKVEMTPEEGTVPRVRGGSHGRRRCTSRPSLSRGLDGSRVAVGKGWRGGKVGGRTAATAGLSGLGVGVTVGRVMLGLRM